MAQPRPDESSPSSLFWMRVDAPVVDRASRFEPDDLQSMLGIGSRLLTALLEGLNGIEVIYPAAGAGSVQSDAGASECLFLAQAPDPTGVAQRLREQFQADIQQTAEELRDCLNREFNWQAADLSGCERQIAQCFRFRVAWVAVSSEGLETAFRQMARVIRSHRLIPHLIEDDQDSDGRPRCTLYGRFTRLGSPRLAPRTLEQWWVDQARRLGCLQDDERLSAPALLARMSRDNRQASSSPSSPIEGSSRIFLELRGPNLLHVLDSAEPGSAQTRLNELSRVVGTSIVPLLSRHSASLVPNSDRRIILCVGPADALALAESLQRLAAGFSPPAVIGMVVAAPGSAWNAILQALDQMFRSRRPAPRSSSGRFMEMRVLKTHAQVSRVKIPLDALQILGQLVSAFRGLNGERLSNRWAYRFRALSETMKGDQAILRSELKRTLDHADSVCADHRRLIQALLDNVLRHGGDCSDFAALVTTTVLLARGVES